MIHESPSAQAAVALLALAHPGRDGRRVNRESFTVAVNGDHALDDHHILGIPNRGDNRVPVAVVVRAC